MKQVAMKVNEPGGQTSSTLSRSGQVGPKGSVAPDLTEDEDRVAAPDLTEDEDRVAAPDLTDSEDEDKDEDRVAAPDLTDSEDEETEVLQGSSTLIFQKVKSQNSGLRGGARGKAPGTKPQQNKTNHPRLINRNNDCFVNSVIQLVRPTGYASFLKTQLPPLLAGAPADSYRTCRALAKLYSDQKRGAVSAAQIRSYVAQHSGKLYLDVGTQQDAEEFLRSLEATISEELEASEEFQALRGQHWGREDIRRKFLDNTETGKCRGCGYYPSSQDEPFLLMKLNIPRSASSVNLSALIQSHYSESTTTEKIKCSNCCPHDKEKIVCPQTGSCSLPSTEQCHLTKAPQFLFLQLLRYDANLQKVMTLVKIENELVLPSTDRDKYEPVAALNHIGTTRNTGHYVTYLKIDSDQWMLLDDTNIQLSSLEQANTADNYILLFKKKKIVHEAEIFELSHDGVGDAPAPAQEKNADLKRGKNKGEEAFVEGDPPAPDKESCNLCKNSKMHNCQICKKPVCNFCTEPFDDNEMKRKHFENDPRCIQVQNTTKEMKANQTKEKQQPLKNKDISISLDSQIEALEAKQNRNQKEKEELRRLKARRQRQNETPLKKAARLTKHQEYLHEQRANETPEETAARLKKVSEQMQQNRIGGDADQRLQMFKNRIRFGPSFPCITCHQVQFKNQVVEYDIKLKEVLREKCPEPLFRRTLSSPPDNFYITIEEDKSQDYRITMTNRKKNTALSNEGQEGNISTGPPSG